MKPRVISVRGHRASTRGILKSFLLCCPEQGRFLAEQFIAVLLNRIETGPDPESHMGMESTLTTCARIKVNGGGY